MAWMRPSKSSGYCQKHSTTLTPMDCGTAILTVEIHYKHDKYNDNMMIIYEDCVIIVTKYFES